MRRMAAVVGRWCGYGLRRGIEGEHGVAGRPGAGERDGLAGAAGAAVADLEGQEHEGDAARIDASAEVKMDFAPLIEQMQKNLQFGGK
jgi:hypothetical protein